MGCGGSKLSLPSPIVSDGGEAEQAGENKRNDENGSWSTSEYVELNKLVKEASVSSTLYLYMQIIVISMIIDLANLLEQFDSS